MNNYEEGRDRKVNAIEKKLDALIDALGFDVEETEEVSIPSGQILIPSDYALTKRDVSHSSPFTWLDTNSDAWSSIVEYVLEHKQDIEGSVNDFGVLLPVLNHFNGVK